MENISKIKGKFTDNFQALYCEYKENNPIMSRFYSTITSGKIFEFDFDENGNAAFYVDIDGYPCIPDNAEYYHVINIKDIESVKYEKNKR